MGKKNPRRLSEFIYEYRSKTLIYILNSGSNLKRADKNLDKTRGYGLTSFPRPTKYDGFYNTNGLTTGNGFTNGNGLTDGNGLTNGNGPTINYHLIKPYFNSIKNQKIKTLKTKALKKRITSLLLTIIILLLPLTIYVWEIERTEHQRISIDGEFEDWTVVFENSDEIHDQMENGNVNLVDYRINKNDLYYSFYLEVYGLIFNGIEKNVEDEIITGMDSIHIFLDTDSNHQTGYKLNSIGADYLIEMEGYNGAPCSSSIKLFENNRDSNDWNGWSIEGGSLEIGVKDGRLEAQIPYNALNSKNSDILALFHIQDCNGNEDFSDEIICDNGFLKINAEYIGDKIFSAGSKSNLISSFTFKSKHDDIELNSLTLSRRGTAVDSDTADLQLYNNNKILASGRFTEGIVKLELIEPLILKAHETINLDLRLDISPKAISSHVIGIEMESKDIKTIQDIPVIIKSNTKLNYICEVTKQIVIDGAFGDWENVPGNIDSDSNSLKNSNINVENYRIALGREELSFYFDVKGEMLGGTFVPIDPGWINKNNYGRQLTPSIEINDNKIDIEIGSDKAQNIKEKLPLPKLYGEDSAYIFFDIDMNSETGYNCDDVRLGADYMVKISGKNGKVLDCRYYEFGSGDPAWLLKTSNSNNWNWKSLGTVPVAKDSTRLETQIELKKLELLKDFPKGIRVYFYIEDWSGAKDDLDDSIEIKTQINNDITWPDFQGYQGTRGSGMPLKEVTNGIGDSSYDKFGWSVSGDGDINNDGYTDIIVGAPYRSGTNGDWWNDNWLNRKKLTFDNSDQTKPLSNFPVLINLSSENFDYAKANLNASDLRFIDSDGTTELKYHIEDWDPSGYSYIWVNITEIKESPSIDYIWMYYNNSAASDNQDITGTYDETFSGVWHLNETGIDTRFDSTKNYNNGTPNNYEGDEATTGKIDGADEFENGGTGDYIDCGTNSIPNSDYHTITVWVNLDLNSGDSEYLLISNQDLAVPRKGIGLFVRRSDGAIGKWLNSAYHFSSINKITSNEWAFIAINGYKHPSSGYLEISMDGSSRENIYSGDTNNLTIVAGTSLVFGKWPGPGPTLETNGILDEIQISKVSRSLDWIRAQYLSVNNKFITFGPEEVKNSGAAYVFFGSPTISLSDINATQADVIVLGESINDNLGWSVATAGDLNGDRFDDFILGEPGNNSNSGCAHIFYGRQNSDWKSIYVASEANMTINGEIPGDRFGFSVACAGNVNNDEFDDVIIGAPGYNSATGRAYIFCGTGKGLNDIITADSGNQIHVFKGTNDGVWLTDFALDVGSLPISVFVEDANNDGYNDIISADYYSDAVSVFNGTERGGFEQRCILSVGWTPRSVFVRDVNNDTLNDIVTADETDGTITIYNGTSGSGWEPKTVLPVGNSPRSVFIGDANNDGINDIVTADANDDTVTIYKGTSSGVWEPKTVLTVGDYPHSVFVADANNDSYNDILTADRNDNTVTIYNGTSNNNWEPKFNLSVGVEPFNVFIGDANNDGLNDILTADKEDNSVTIYNGTSSGYWDPKFSLSVGRSPRSVFVCDANNDGFNDILTADYMDNATSIYSGTFSGTWKPRMVLKTCRWPYPVVVGDVNNVNLEGTFSAIEANSIIIGQTSNSKFGWSVSTAGDMNSDGVDDVIVGAPGENKSYVYLFNSTVLGNIKQAIAITQGIGDDTSETTTNDLKIDDGIYYDVNKQKTMFIDSFGTSGITGIVTSVLLKVQYKTDSSYTPDRKIEWALDGQTFKNTTVQILQTSIESTPREYDLYAQGVDTLAKIQTMDIRFYNSNSGGQCGVYFDYLWLEVQTKTPAATLVLSGTGDFGWSVSEAGDVNNDGLNDVLIGAPDSSGNTAGNAYIKFGNRQSFDNEAIGITPLGWTQSGNPLWDAIINNSQAYGGSGNSIEFPSKQNNYAGVKRTFIAVEKGLLEFYIRTSRIDTENFYIRIGMDGTDPTQNAVQLGLGGTSSPTDGIYYYEGDGQGGFVRTPFTKYNADDWIQIRIVFDCTIDTYNVHINGILVVVGAKFINNNVTLNTVNFSQRYDTYPTSFVDEVVWLGSDLEINLTGAAIGDQFGYSVSDAGDINNDGFDDVIIGAPYNDSLMGNINDAGAVYVFYGNKTIPNKSALESNNYSYGEKLNHHFGWSVASAGNVNGDLYSDIIIGAPDVDEKLLIDNGKAYVMSYDAPTVIPEIQFLAIPIFLTLFIIALFKRKYRQQRIQSYQGQGVKT
jgi:hypothetical protein